MTTAGLDHQSKNKNETNAVTLKTYMENEKKNTDTSFWNYLQQLQTLIDQHEWLEEAGSNDPSAIMEPSCVKCTFNGALIQTFPDRDQGTFLFHQ